MNLIEIKPIQPFVGSYVCPLADADIVDDQLSEDEAGNIIKKKVPRKRFIGLIATTRQMTATELRSAIAGTLPENIEFNSDDLQRVSAERVEDAKVQCVVHPNPPTVRVPSDVADSLIARGLAQAVKSKPSKRSAT